MLSTTALGLVALMAASCATNPVTGEKQFVMMSEAQEIATGQQMHPEALKEFGKYEDPELQGYVDRLGQTLARSSHRPDLPWTFTVVDSAAINAFALPGGYIYITRGIMTYLNSEAELVGVLGHEIGHVTARHAVEQYSRAMGSQLGLTALMIFVPQTRPFGDAAGSALSLMFLKHGRDDELQSDRLGAEYAAQNGWDPAGVMGMLRALARLDETEGSSRGVPGWLSTHPEPANRVNDVQPLVAELRQKYGDLPVRRAEYLNRIEGIMVGENPREGVIRGNAFLHPDMRFALDFPEGWQIQNGKAQVVAKEPNRNNFVLLQLIDNPERLSIEEVARRSMANAGFRQAGGERSRVNGLNAYLGLWQGQMQQLGDVAARTAHIEHGGRVFLVVGLTPANEYRSNEAVLARSVESFRPISAAEAERIKPNRLRFYTVRRGDTWQSIAQRYDAGGMSAARLAIFNGFAPSEQPREGDRVKVVVPE